MIPVPFTVEFLGLILQITAENRFDRDLVNGLIRLESENRLVTGTQFFQLLFDITSATKVQHGHTLM